MKIRSSFLALSLLLTAPISAQPAFVDVAARAGIASENSARTQWIDVDGDNWLDLVIGGAPFRILFSKPTPVGGRTFVDGAKETGLADRDHSMLLWGDLNGDARLDAISIVTQTAAIWKTNPQTYALYLGDGRGHFRRQTRSGLEQTRHTATHGAALCDLDLDGHLDVAFGNQYDGDGLEAQPMRVFQGDGRGVFADVTEKWGFPTRTVAAGAAHAPRPLYGLSAADIDNDGFPELLGAAYGRQWNTLWKRSPTSPSYDDMAANYGVDGDAIRHGRYAQGVKDSQRKAGIEREDEPPFRSNGNTFSLVPADFDGDGDLDLFSAEITHWWAGDSSDLSALLVNRLETRREPFFERQLQVSSQPDPQTGRLDAPGLGLARDHGLQTQTNWNQGDLQAHWADLDLDGLLDLLVCESDYPQNRLRLWLQQPDHTFVEREREMGLDWPNCPGLALGDYDGDGDLDLAATGSRTRWPQARPVAALALFENRLAPPQNGWLKLRLVGNGTSANSNAFGARVTLVTSDGKAQTREVTGPYGHWAAQTQPGEVHFGLGTATATSVEIAWPDAARTRTRLSAEQGTAPARNSLVTIRQLPAKER
ncbi:MAG TPA: CRTAC1 family protein [Abditibacterium sp.]|jgi:hypothetical protein